VSIFPIRLMAGLEPTLAVRVLNIGIPLRHETLFQMWQR